MSAARRICAVAAAAVACAMLATPVSARKRPVELPPATSGLIDNVNGIAPGKSGTLERFTGLLIDRQGRVERRLIAGEARPYRLTFRMDAKGATLIPSFVAPHVRLMDAGIALMTLDLSDARSLAEAQARIADYARTNPAKKWILGQGWDSAKWGSAGRMPTAVDLDTAIAATPALLVSADGELGWANSAALKLAGVPAAKAVAAPMAGDAMQKVARVAPAPYPKDRDIGFDKAQRRFVTLGYATVTDMATSIEDWQSYRRAGDRGALRLRVIGYADGLAHMLTIAGPAPSPWLYDDHLKLNGVHIALDGTRASGTAWMKAPPTVAPRTQGIRLRNQMSRAAMDGFQIALSAYGDAAVVEAQMANAEIAASYGKDRRDRLETDGAAIDAVILPSSPFRVLGRMMDAGSSFGEAFAAMTAMPAYSAFAEQRIGALEQGQWADFLLLDHDITTATPDAIVATKISEHWIGGKRVWREGDN